MGFKILGNEETVSAFTPGRTGIAYAGQNPHVMQRNTMFPYSILLPFNNGVIDGSNYGRLYYVQNACPIVGDKMYIFGGYTGAATGNLWEVNLKTFNIDIVTTSGGPPGVRYGAMMTAIGTKLYMWGGYSGAAYLKDTWEFDTTTNTWSQFSSDDFPYLCGYCGAVSDGTYVYSVCGIVNAASTKSIYRFDPAGADGARWSLLSTQGTTMTIRYNHSTTIYNGKIYICGGYSSTITDSDSSGGYLYSMYEYNIGTDTWTRKENMRTQDGYGGATDCYRARGAFNATGGFLYMHGGYDGSYLSSGLMYDITNNVWYQTPGLLATRMDAGTGVYNGSIFIVHGYGNGANATHTNIECIPRPKRTWYQIFDV